MEKTKKLNEMLTALDSSKVELTTLQAVITTSPTSASVEDKNKKEEKLEEKKNWLKRQWEGVTSKEEWKTNT